MALVSLQGKVTPEVLEQFNTAKENSEAGTFNAFFELLLEAYLNPKTKPVEVPTPTVEQQNALQLKDNEIGRLQQWNGTLTETNELLTSENLELKQLVESTPIPTNLVLEDGQEVITIPPIVRLVLNEEAEIAKRKTGRDFTHGDILLNSFWESVEVGRVYPFKQWTRSDLVKLKKQLEAEQS